MKIGELGAPGSYQLGSIHGGDSDVVVRLGLDKSGKQVQFSDNLNHISVWCEDFAVRCLPLVLQWTCARFCAIPKVPPVHKESHSTPRKDAVTDIVSRRREKICT